MDERFYRDDKCLITFEDHHSLKSTFRPRFTMEERFHREDERLNTFECWPLKWLSKKELAMCGMFYTGKRDVTKCYFCEVEIGNWEQSDEPVAEHLRWSPNCALLRRRCTNNVPINRYALEELLPRSSYDTCGLSAEYECMKYLTCPNILSQYSRKNDKCIEIETNSETPQNKSKRKCDDDITSNNHLKDNGEYIIEIPTLFLKSTGNSMKNFKISTSSINIRNYLFIYQLITLFLIIVLFVLGNIHLCTEIKK